MKTSITSKRPVSTLNALTLAALAILPAALTHAADISWTGGPASYTNAANWNPATVPGVNDRAINDNGAGNVVQINSGNPNWIVNGIRAGSSTGNGAFEQNGPNVYVTNAVGRGAVRLGVAPGRTGAYTLNSGALNYTGEFNVGELGTGTLNVFGGSVTGNGTLAINAGSTLDAITATMGGTNKSDYTWFEQGFFTPVPTRGIPTAGSTFVSETLPDHSFTMPASYSANNAVQVFAGIPNATITFTAPVAADTLSLLGSSGFGDSTVNYTIHYADTTTQSGTLAILDWFNNGGAVAFRAGGRSSANGLDVQNNGVNPVLSSFDIALVNVTSPVTSVALTHNGAGGVAAIMAVSSGAGGVFTPRAISGYNQDIVFGATEPVYVASTVTNVLNQTTGNINITGELWVGNFGAGVYNLVDGTNTFGNWTAFGRSGGHGKLNMSGGVINKNGNGNFLVGTGYQAPAGSTPSGIVNQSGGTINSTGEFMIPENAPATGEYNLSGTGVLNVNNWMQVGRSGGSGLMTMTGGTVNKTGGGNFIVGDNATGVLYQSGGSISVNNEGWVGQGGSGNGTYNLSGGSISVGNWIAIGRAGGTGVVNLTNGVINKVNNGNFAIGSGGNGTLNQYGGAVSNTVNAGSITYLAEAGGAGTWYMFGGTANLGVLQFCQGGNGSGALYLNGGLLTVREVSCGVAGANGNFFFNGGTLQASADTANFFAGLGGAYVDVGGAVIDSQGFNIAMAQTLGDFGGGLTKLGAGKLTLTGGNNYSGATLVNAGTLAVTTDSSASSVGGYTVAAGAKLGVKVQNANMQLNTSSLTFNSGATTFEADLGNFGNPTAAPVNLSGNLAANGTVTVNLVDAMPQLGQFPLIKYGTKSGAGSFVIGTLPFGVVASIVNNTANNSIDINITTVNLPRWDGQAGGNWDIGLTTNWVNIGDGLPTFYGQGNAVMFDDTAAGTTTANLVATVTPSSVTFNNSSKDYTLSGSGKISSSTGLAKQGSGVTTIANTGGNDYTGATVISGGTLSVASLANGGSASAIGASSASPTNLVLSGGTLRYSGSSVAINRGYSLQGAGGSIETVGNLTLSGSVAAAAGSGFIKSGLGQLAYKSAGNNSLTGAGAQGYLVTDGSVVFDGSAGGQTNTVQGSLAVAGATANATIVLTNTTMTSSGNTDVGIVANSTGTMNINSNSSLTVGSWFTMGDTANSTSTVNLNGGSVTVNNGRLFLCSAPGTIAALNITNAVINKNGDYFAVVNGGWNGTGARTGIVYQVNSTVGGGSEMWVGDGGGAGGNDSLGIYNLISGTLTVNNWMGVGRDGSQGIFNMTGGTLNKGGGGDLVIGRGGNGTVGTFNMTGGTLNKGVNNPLIVGQDGGLGTFNQSAGAVDSGNEFWVGQGGGGTGFYNMSGGTLNVQSWVAIGRGGGNGTVNMTGGTFTKVGGGQFIVGDNSTGLFNQSGSSTLSINNELWIGQAGGGNGVFNLTNGNVTIGSWFAVGRESGQGVVNIYGGSMTKSGGGNISIAHNDNAHGTVNMYGGAFTNTTSETWIGENGGNTAKGEWNMYGGTAVLGVVHLANASDVMGQLNLNGGSLTANEVSTGNNAAPQRELNFNGGTLAAGANNANFIHDLSAVNVQAGGAVINSAGYTIGISQPLLGGGGLNKTGNGTLNLNGVNTYTGTTLVSQGALGGTGTIAGPVSVASGGTLAPGNSIGTLTINNTLGLAAGSSTVMEIGTGASDLVAGATTITYGGTLVIKNLGGLLALNDTFNLFDAASFNGSFSSVVSQTPGQTVTWDTSKLTVDGTVRVSSVVSNPVTLSSVVSGNSLNLSWPASQLGYRLEVQTNSLAVGVSNNWATVPGSTSVTSMSVPIIPGNPTVFYRLVFP